MENCLYVVALEAGFYLGGVRDIPMDEGEVRVVVEHSCVVQTRGGFQVIERDYIIAWICQDEMSDKP